MRKYYGFIYVLVLLPEEFYALDDIYINSKITLNCVQCSPNISTIDMRGSFIELAALDVILLIITFAFMSISCCYIGAKCAQHECRCNICKGIINLESDIGCGRFGSVYKISVTDPYTGKVTRDKYVIKSVEVDNITEAELCQKEANQLRQLQHKNIVKFIGDFIHVEYGFCRSKYYHVMIIEYCEHGDLVQLVENYEDQNRFIKEPMILHILEQLCEAIHYIHRQNIVHRDIKLANILMCKDNSIRLSDFGLSDKVSKIRTRKVGTRSYMAPEEFKEFYQGPQRYDYSLEDKKSTDMWCLGCVLYELCTRKLLVRLDSVLGKEVARNPSFTQNFVANIPQRYSKSLRNIIKRLLNVDPKKRPRAEELLKKNVIKRFHKLSPYKLAKEEKEDFSNYLEPTDGVGE